MSARTTAKVLRRRSIALVEQLTYVPVSRLTLNIMLNVLVSQQWLLAGLRPAADYLIARTAPVVPGVRVKRVVAPVEGEWLWAPEADDAAGVVLVLHGSGYLICSSRTHRGFASHLSEYSGMPTFTVDYRLAPEHPFPGSRRRCIRRLPLAAGAGARSGEDRRRRGFGRWAPRGRTCPAAAQRRAAATGGAGAVRPTDRSVVPGLHRRPAGPESAAGSAHGQTRRRVVRR